MPAFQPWQELIKNHAMNCKTMQFIAWCVTGEKHMVRIEAIIRPSRLDEVKSALDELGVHGISVTEIKGAGKQKGYTQHYRGSEYQVNLLPKVQIIVVVADSQQDSVIGAIEGAARTGEIGDGKIFVTPVLEAVRIRTGERGDTAVS
jgi:nitrogen regulatory protein P-II 1